MWHELKDKKMDDEILYEERLQSNKTTILFIVLSIVMAGLFLWRYSRFDLEGLAITWLVFCIFFIFYVFNYRTLIVLISQKNLTLKFGVFRWKIPVENIEDCYLDDISGFMKYGGAGIHFMTVHQRYRASFNFLEYPRVLIRFKNKIGPIKDLSFSTRNPDKVIQLLQDAVASEK